MVVSNDSDDVKTHAEVQPVIRAVGSDSDHGIKHTFDEIFWDGGALVGDKQC